MSPNVEHPDRGEKTEVYVESPIRNRKLTKRCNKHGERLTTVPNEVVRDMVIDRGGQNYQLEDPGDTRIAYCEECMGQLRTRSYELSDKSDLELVENRIDRGWGYGRGQGFRQLFEPVSVSVAGGLSNCPYCGDEFDVVNRNNGRCICPEHGEMHVKIKQLDVA